MMRRFSLKAAALAGVLLAGALLPALAQQSSPIVGDVNGDGRITSADALAVYAYLAGRPLPATFDVLGRGDADGDGRITRADGDLIMRAAVGQAVADRPVGKPAAPGTGPAEGVMRLQCVASVGSGVVSCEDPAAASTGGAQGDRIAYGGQHVNVSMLTSNITVANDTFAFDLRVKNLIGQAIGTNDGITVDPVRVFVAGDVQNLSSNGNTGPITMANHDGTAPSPYTSEPDKFFSYPEIIQPGATSAARRWKIHVSPGAQGFRFFLYVSSPVVYPHGWVDVYPKTAEISAGATLQLIDTVRNHLGRPTGQKAAWSSASPAIAMVDANGLVTAVGDGVVEITGSAGSPPAVRAPGKMTLTVRTASLDSSTITANPDTLPVHQKSVLTLQLRSASGDPLTRGGGTVVFSASGGTLLGIKDNGDGTYTDTLTSTAVGTIKVSTTLNGAAFRDTAEVVFTAGAAAAYRVTSSAAAVAAGSPVTITAQTIDADGNAVSGAGATVTWTSTNGGTFASATSAVDSTGAAKVVFTTSTTAGVTHTVTATDAASLTGTSGNVVTEVGAATQLVFTQQPTDVTAGSAIAPAVTVAVQDANGNVVTAAADSVSIAIGTNPGSGTLSGTTKVAPVNGVATFSNLAIDKAGTGYTLAAAAGSLTGATSNTFNVAAGAASQLTITTQPTDSVQSGAAFPRQPVIQLRDASGNAVAQSGVTVTAAIATGGGTLGGTATASTNASGVATFTDLAISGAVGDRTLSFTAAGVTAATSSSIHVRAGATSQLAITTQPSATTQSGAAFAQQPVVQLRDASGNAVAQSGVAVTAAIASGGGTLGGTATASTDANGTATFTGLSITATAADRTLSFSATGLTSATSGTVSVTAGAATQLAITTQPSGSAQNGAAFAQQPVVQLQDASGNPVAQSGVTVTAAIATGGGTLGGTATASTDANGTATFTNLSITGTVGDRTLSFSATGLTGATSGTVSVTAGAATQLALTTQPSSSVKSGAAFAQQPVIHLRDASGNPVAQSGVAVTAAIATGGGTLGGTATASTDANGTATFTDLSITGTVGDRTLSFSATGLTGATSGTISVTAGAATQLALTTQPADSVQSGAAFPQQPVIQLRDASGNAVAQSGVTVTAAIATGGGTLGGTATASTDANGTATFTNLSITGTVGDRTLSFSATGLTAATSSSIHVRAGAASQVVITTQPSSTAAAGAAFAQQPAVQLQDASGNAVAQAGVTVTAAVASGGGTLGGTVTATTGAGGSATFTDLSIGGTVGDRTLSFSASGLTGATSGTISVTAGTAAALAFSVQPSNVVANAAIAPAVQVSIVDAFGNVTASTANVTVAIGTNPSGGTLSGTATVAATAGVATFSGLSVNLTGTGYTLAASSGSLTGATSSAFDVTHGPLHHFLVEAAGGGAIGSQLAGTAFNVRVTAQDEYNNTVTNFTGTTAFTSTPTGGISAGATSGAFTAGVLSSHSITFGAAGSFTLTATNSAGAESGTSNSFDVQAPPTAVNEGPASNSSPGQPFHAFYSTSGSPQTYTLAAPGLLVNDNLGFPAATITSFGADSLGGSVTTYAAGSTVNPLPGSGRTTGSLSVGADGRVTFTPPDDFTGNYVFRYRLTNARGASDGQVTIAVGARPSAVNDTYSPQLVGNVPINTATSTQFRVTTNDTGDGKILAITGQSNGTATLNADSTFTFRPNAGYNGPASFTYTVTNGFGTAAPAAVSLTVGTPIWFISSAAAAGGDGRYDAPFNALSSFAAINNGTGNNPAISDNIFLYAGTYTGPVTLLNGQKVIGQRATAALSSVAGVTWPADAGPEPAMNSTAALDVTASGATAVTLANSGSTSVPNNTLRGFNFGNVGAPGTALAGTTFGTLIISEVGISTDGRALNLTTGTLSGSLTGVTSTGGVGNILLSGVATIGTFSLGSGALSGSTADALAVTGASTGTFTYGGTIGGGTGAAVNLGGGTSTLTLSGNVTQGNSFPLLGVTGGHTGTLTMTGQLVATNGTGLQFSDADGTYNLDGVLSASQMNGGDAALDIVTHSSGTFTFGSNLAIVNPSGAAVNIYGSSPALTVKGPVTQGAGKRGIYLQDITGGTSTFSGVLTLNTTTQNAFEATYISRAATVVAPNAANVLSTTTGTALRVNNVNIGTGGLVFQSISANGAPSGIMLNNTGTLGGLTVSGTGSASTGGTIQNTSGDAVSFTNTVNPRLSFVVVQNNKGSGIRASGVSGLSLSNSTVDTNGDTNGGSEAGILLLNLAGTNLITASTIKGSFEDNVRWTPSVGAQTLTLSNTTVGPNNATSGNSGVNIIGTGTANATLNVSGGTFTQNKSFGIGTSFTDISAHTVNITGATFTDNNMAIGLATAMNADVTFDIANNPSILRSRTNAIQVLAGATSTTSAQIRGKIRNNVIGDNTVDSGARDGIGIAIEVNDDADAVVDVTGNNIKHTDQDGIFIQARDPNTTDGDLATAVTDFTVTGNTVGTPDDNTAFPFFSVYGIRVESRHNTTVCLDISGNTSANVGAADFFLRQRQTTSTFKLERYTGSGADDTAVASFVQAQNPYTGVSASATHESGIGFTAVTNGTCRTVP